MSFPGNHGKTMGKRWENMGKPWENDGKIWENYGKIWENMEQKYGKMMEYQPKRWDVDLGRSFCTASRFLLVGRLYRCFFHQYLTPKMHFFQPAQVMD